MRAFVAVVLVLLARDAMGEEPLAWAYTVVVRGIEDPNLHTLADSDRAFTMREIWNPYAPGDWFPLDHPEPPSIVAYGRAPHVVACALCHYHNGKGRPENAGIAGLPKDYIVRQMHDYRDGLRHSAEPRKANTGMMIAIAQAMTDEEIDASATYYASMRWTPWISVIETDTVPPTEIRGGMHVEVEDAGTRLEPLGRRILEVPENAHRTEALRDPRSGFIAYVPVGSVHMGEALATTGAGRTQPCGACHRHDLDGLGAAPGLRGRSPSYVARQLYDYQRGTRRGIMASQMAPVVAGLSPDDILDLAAYLASLEPWR
jgi:cytochrome c553